MALLNLKIDLCQKEPKPVLDTTLSAFGRESLLERIRDPSPCIWLLIEVTVEGTYPSWIMKISKGDNVKILISIGMLLLSTAAFAETYTCYRISYDRYGGANGYYVQIEASSREEANAINEAWRHEDAQHNNPGLCYLAGEDLGN